ncbi:GNAT family N-acetyltransferase [Alkalihalobacillus sp. TS-13]|uniref:GNAT family N-acetyltransferase n=1 Tax=Alkalihalobacillus sp. TS-13 TaxID=2842455 RepID=UPI001C88C33D|nr:GNAT family N-acetyltransferase [Alkalihalobacillus sp. TS-13]
MKSVGTRNWDWGDFTLLQIRRPKMDDMEELHQLFRTVITDTFAKEGIEDMLDDLSEEIEAKKKYLKSDLESNGENRFFLIAVDGDEIIGCIEYGPASELINKCTNNAYKGLMEIGTVFVHPDYQRKGVGKLLLNEIYLSLEKKRFEEFCLDSGYSSSQKIWKKKFGEPAYVLKDYWGEGYDHMIWNVKVDDCITQENI